MAFNLTLYNNTTDPRGINKNLTDSLQIQGCNLKEDCSLKKPTFVITKPISATLTDYNYLFCPLFNRYYFIDDYIKLQGDLYEIVTLECDVLESFKSYFLERVCYIERCEKQFKDKNYAMDVFYDSEYPIRSDCVIRKIPVGVVGNSYNYFLTTNGGVQ